MAMQLEETEVILRSGLPNQNHLSPAPSLMFDLYLEMVRACPSKPRLVPRLMPKVTV